MSRPVPDTQLQLRSLIRSTGQIEISLAEIPVPQPEASDQVVVHLQAAPLNPSDLGLLFGSVDPSTLRASGTSARPVLSAAVPQSALEAMRGRLDASLPVGNEGAGVVVAAGDSEAAGALLGKKVAVLGGAMYSQYRSVPLDQCLLIPDAVAIAEAASAFVNPLTALGMVETMRSEGHRALVHTAAGSNLGQMLNRLCLREGVGLVNIVRSPQQAADLRKQGATYALDSSAPSFHADLTEAVVATGATLAFDAIGGGTLAGQILAAMERAAARDSRVYSRYGTNIHKQLYIYGGLDTRPTEFKREFGMSWGMGGWLVMNFMNKVGPAAVAALKQRVAAELTTTFASSYSRVISLAETLHPDNVAVYAKRATGQKFLIDPSR